MRTPVTLRLDAEILAAARLEARRDSRTLTNFIEVALRKRLGLDRRNPDGSPTELSAAADRPDDCASASERPAGDHEQH
jgi:hypothetical protein